MVPVHVADCEDNISKEKRKEIKKHTWGSRRKCVSSPVSSGGGLRVIVAASPRRRCSSIHILMKY